MFCYNVHNTDSCSLFFLKTLTNQNQMLGLSYLYVTFHVRSRRYFILTNIFTVSRLSISNVRSCPFSSILPQKVARQCKKS